MAIQAVKAIKTLSYQCDYSLSLWERVGERAI
jgi:hypothetical protein